MAHVFESVLGLSGLARRPGTRGSEWQRQAGFAAGAQEKQWSWRLSAWPPGGRYEVTRRLAGTLDRSDCLASHRGSVADGSGALVASGVRVPAGCLVILCGVSEAAAGPEESIAVWRSEELPGSKAGQPAGRKGKAFHLGTTGSRDLDTPLRTKNPGLAGDAAGTCGGEISLCL